MSGSNTTVFEAGAVALDVSISKKAIYAGGIIGIIVNVIAMTVPLLGYIGGGIIAGFVGAYIVGGRAGGSMASSLG